MYKISQFSKISGLTIKALRYYDHENILIPSIRCEDNQYRLYNDEDLQKALYIKALRSLEFSMLEIKEVLKTVKCEDDLNYILQEKIDFIKKNISKEKELIQKINESFTPLDIQISDNSYPIDIVEIDEMMVATIRFTGKYSDLDSYVPTLFKQVKNNINGAHFNCYYDEGYMEHADIELCVPAKKWMTNDIVSYKTLPKIKALHTTHYGNYETLYKAYKMLFDYANSHHIKTIIPSREIYVKGPGMIFKGNPSRYITEILLPFEIYGKDIYEKSN